MTEKQSPNNELFADRLSVIANAVAGLVDGTVQQPNAEEQQNDVA